MAKDRYFYIALFDYADDGISIEFPDLKGCYSCADKDDTAMALKNAKEALGLHIYGMEQDREPLPEPTSIKDIQLDNNQIPVLIEVFMPPIRERVKTVFVKKTISLPAWLAVQAEQDGVNYSKVCQNALMEHLGIKHS